MWIRSMVAGFVLAFFMATSTSRGVAHWLLVEGPENYFFGSVVDGIAPTLYSVIAIEPVVHLFVVTLMMVLVTILGALVWEVLERSFIAAAVALGRSKVAKG